MPELHFLPARLFLGPTSSLSNLYILSPYFDFSFSRKALRFFPALGVSRLHLVEILVGKTAGISLSFGGLKHFSWVGYALLFLGPSAIAMRFLLRFGSPRLLRSCSLNP